MKYFLPDAYDRVDPQFDDRSETSSMPSDERIHAHEVFGERVYDGIVVSKAIVDSKYPRAARSRLRAEGARRFFRAGEGPTNALTFMGDCGAFSALDSPAPVDDVEDVVGFYDACGVDLGISLDRVITEWREGPGSADSRSRQAATLELARDFWGLCRGQRVSFLPVGVAQGWDTTSYTSAIAELQKIGFRYIAVGGIVRLRSAQILALLEATRGVRRADTRFHLLGVARLEALAELRGLGVVSFDSTAPLRRAFLDGRANYFTAERSFMAIRVPQTRFNRRLRARVRSGAVDEAVARRHETDSLRVLAEFERGRVGVDSVIEALGTYQQLYDPGVDRSRAYRETLEAAPWRACRCDVCRALGYQVILFRGAERNRRRGFHNVWVWYRRLRASR
jgi:hypothetical protein